MCDASWAWRGGYGRIAFGVGSGCWGLWSGGCQLVILEGFLDALGSGGADALVDGEGLLQVRGGLGGVAFLEVAVAESF